MREAEAIELACVPISYSGWAQGTPKIVSTLGAQLHPIPFPPQLLVLSFKEQMAAKTKRSKSLVIYAGSSTWYGMEAPRECGGDTCKVKLRQSILDLEGVVTICYNGQLELQLDQVVQTQNPKSKWIEYDLMQCVWCFLKLWTSSSSNATAKLRKKELEALVEEAERQKASAGVSCVSRPVLVLICFFVSSAGDTVMSRRQPKMPPRPNSQAHYAKLTSGYIRWNIHNIIIYYKMYKHTGFVSGEAVTRAEGTEDASPSASSSVAEMKRRLRQPGAPERPGTSPTWYDVWYVIKMFWYDVFPFLVDFDMLSCDIMDVHVTRYPVYTSDIASHSSLKKVRCRHDYEHSCSQLIPFNMFNPSFIEHWQREAVEVRLQSAWLHRGKERAEDAPGRGRTRSRTERPGDRPVGLGVVKCSAAVPTVIWKHVPETWRNHEKPQNQCGEIKWQVTSELTYYLT